MNDQSDLKGENLNEKFKILLDEDNEIKKWNEGLLIKSLILLPVIIFIIGLFIVNKPENLKDVLFLFLYPLVLILIGLIVLFVMRNNMLMSICTMHIVMLIPAFDRCSKRIIDIKAVITLVHGR